ncbi:helix-turn-helix domain-containing protein [Halopelagius longus]|nr:helix-turn-helix domain-containing protein [Halopelagius longus]
MDNGALTPIRCFLVEYNNNLYVRELNVNSGNIDPQVTAYSCRQCEFVALGNAAQKCCGEEMEPVEVGAVNEPTLMDLLSQVFGISQTGVDICVYLVEEEEATTDEIATALEYNRSTVSRQLTQMRELGVIECRKKSLNEGGQVYLYSPVSPNEMRRRHRECLLTWVTDAFRLLDEIDKQKLKAVSERSDG